MASSWRWSALIMVSSWRWSCSQARVAPHALHGANTVPDNGDLADADGKSRRDLCDRNPKGGLASGEGGYLVFVHGVVFMAADKDFEGVVRSIPAPR